MKYTAFVYDACKDRTPFGALLFPPTAMTRIGRAGTSHPDGPVTVSDRHPFVSSTPFQ